MDESARVWFPSVHGEAGELIQLVCFANDDLKGMVKALSGIDDDAARNIIGAARFGENHRAAGQHILISVSNPQFSGLSYGLALAIADKQLRHGSTLPGTARLIASGRIEPNGKGQVGAIEELNAKLRLVTQRMNRGDVFVFPRDNLDPDNREQKQLLAQIQEQGGRWIALGHIDEGQDRLWGRITSAHTKATSTARKTPAILAAAVIALLLLSAAILVPLLPETRTDKPALTSVDASTPKPETNNAPVSPHKTRAGIITVPDATATAFNIIAAAPPGEEAQHPTSRQPVITPDDQTGKKKTPKITEQPAAVEKPPEQPIPWTPRPVLVPTEYY